MGQKIGRVKSPSHGPPPFPIWERFGILTEWHRIRPTFPAKKNSGMALDPYGSCPCGSGKKFKWCCQPIHIQIDRAFRQDAEGQHDAALHVMDELVKEHPANPEAWGRSAQLLYQNGKVEEAEDALQKAFDINPNYPFGHLLRGMFRHSEAEFPGALLLFRKAAEVYDPEARDVLGQVYAMIADCEMKLNRPVAARAALQRAVHYQPTTESLRQNLEALFGSESRLPEAARREYRFQSPVPAADSSRRAAWDRALEGAESPRFSDAVRRFEELTQQDPGDTAAWYNLGLLQAWLGDNKAALEALDRYVQTEPDEGRAAGAWTLAEVMRCGYGMEEQADYVEHSVTFQIRDPQPVVSLLQHWEQERRLVALQTGQDEQAFAALILEQAPLLTAGASAGHAAKLASNLLVFEGMLRLWHVNGDSVARVAAEVQKQAGAGLSPPHERSNRANFGDIVAEALVFPVGTMDRPEAERRIREQAERYFEEGWIHRPLHSLNLIPPIDAVGDRTLRKKVLGVVQFLQDCAQTGLLGTYDFDRLRRKLGLATATPPPAAEPGKGPPDIAALGAAELASLKVEDLPDEHVEQAYQTALTLDAQELAGRFAQALVSRPVTQPGTDRFPFYSYLIQRALQQGESDEALNYVNEGERVDCERNEGKRRDDYELRRGQVHVKRGEPDEAEAVFQRLIERSPAKLRYRGSAAEAMLSLRQGQRALRFAEQGLAKAREQNDRDSEHYFLELVSAAKK
jgi:tetratricopeptide (TPR) repeat protein